MNLALVHINRWVCANRAGIKSIRAIVPADVQSQPAALAVPNLEGDIVLKPGKEQYRVELDPGSGRFQERLATNSQGDYYNFSLSFVVRRIRVEVSEFRRRCMNRRVHFVFTDNNDNTYYYRNLRLRSVQADSGQAGGRNQTSFEFTGADATPAAFFNAALVDDPNGQDDKIIIEGITGQKYCLTVGPCDELITVPIETDQAPNDIVIDDGRIVIVTADENGDLITSTVG